ncbi:MAG: type II secretion system protein GspK [Parvularculaceae bacterium]
MTASGTHSREKHQKGYALLLVLWSLALLSLLAAMLMSQNRLAVRMEANAWTALEAQQTAEAGFAIAALKLYEPETHRGGALYGAEFPFEFDGARGEIVIQDELGKLDINEASEDALRALLSAAGASPARAALLASRIVEWRGSASRRPGSVVREEYEAASLGYSPRGRAFQSVGELRLVLGMTDDLFDKAEGALTVFTHASSFDPNAASEILLRAAPGVSTATIDSIRKRRAEPVVSDTSADEGIPAQLRVSLEGRAFSISVQLVAKGRERSYQRVVRVNGGSVNPVWDLELSY